MAGDFLEWEHSSAALVCLAFILSWDIRASPSGSRISWLESRVNRTLTWKSCLTHSYIFLLFFSFFLSGGTGVWIQGFLLAKLVLYCLSHTSNPLSFGYFGAGGSHKLICPGWLWNSLGFQVRCCCKWRNVSLSSVFEDTNVESLSSDMVAYHVYRNFSLCFLFI
jgi:hypothetical protein